jgi:glutathione peroxidase
MHPVFVAAASLMALAVVAAAQETGRATGAKEIPLVPDSFYRLTTKTLEGQPADLRAYAGKVALVVNVASQCGYTPQYAGLEKLYGELKDKGFVVLGFPSNDFGGQEPGTAAEIRQFCSLNYDVTFPLFEKVVTKAGAGQSPLYANLQKQAGDLPGWNFAKYLVGKDGRVVKFYKSGVKPEDPGLRRDIEAALR